MDDNLLILVVVILIIASGVTDYLIIDILCQHHRNFQQTPQIHFRLAELQLV